MHDQKINADGVLAEAKKTDTETNKRSTEFHIRAGVALVETNKTNAETNKGKGVITMHDQIGGAADGALAEAKKAA